MLNRPRLVLLLARAGTIKLGDPFQVLTKLRCGITAEVILAASGRDAEAGCKLSAEASEFFTVKQPEQVR